MKVALPRALSFWVALPKAAAEDFDIKQVVGDLEGKADGPAIGVERGGIGAGQDGARQAGEAEKGAGLHRLEFQHLVHVEPATVLGFNVKHLAAGHAVLAGGAGEFGEQSEAYRRIGMDIGATEDFEGKGQKRVAGKDGGRLIEGAMERRTAAAQIIIIHGGKIVMDQRIAMHAFKGCSDRQSTGRRDVEEPRAFDHQKGAQALPRPQRGVAHGLDKAVRRSGPGQELPQQSFGAGGGGGEGIFEFFLRD